MRWRFITKEGIKVGTTALQQPCCISKFSNAMSMPAPLPSGCPQQHWTGRTGRLQSSSQSSVFGGHENLLGNLQQTISSHLMAPGHIWDWISYQLQNTFCKSEHWTWPFLSYLGRLKIWNYYNFEVTLIPDMLHGPCLLPESFFVPQWRTSFWKQYLEHIFSFNTFVKYAARKSELTLT